MPCTKSKLAASSWERALLRLRLEENALYHLQRRLKTEGAHAGCSASSRVLWLLLFLLFPVLVSRLMLSLKLERTHPDRDAIVTLCIPTV